METRPSPLSLTDLMATAPFSADTQLDVPLKVSMWRNIVIHSTGAEPADILDRVHFVIEADGVTPLAKSTPLWRSQVQARHVESAVRNYNTDSIAICLKGDFSKNPPTKQQMNELVKLVQSLQTSCRIGADHVFMYRPDLAAGDYSPGKAFPSRAFAAMLR